VIAVVTLEGTIVGGRGGPQFLPFGTSTVGSDTIAAALREAAADDSVSAILLRVDSSGGSVTASETIWREVKMARNRGKPVVASMGAVAASGGYYVSVVAAALVANPGTITGSIGVFGGKLVVRGLMDRLGVASDTVRTNANADAWSMDAPFTPEQRAHQEAEVDLLYADFVDRVAEGRNLSTEAVEHVARGRIWTGTDALARGLVDELGGFATAMRRAKVLAGLNEDAEVRMVNYPGFSLLEMLRPRPSSQPGAASRMYSGASALWLGQARW
jgi:protease IV